VDLEAAVLGRTETIDLEGDAVGIDGRCSGDLSGPSWEAARSARV
jgi:hypothetical protein